MSQKWKMVKFFINQITFLNSLLLLNFYFFKIFNILLLTTIAYENSSSESVLSEGNASLQKKIVEYDQRLDSLI